MDNLTSQGNPFDTFDSKEEQERKLAPLSLADTIRPDFSKPEMVEDAPARGLSSAPFSEDGVMRDLISQLDALNTRDGTEKLREAKGDSILEGLMDPKQYKEFAKGVPGGAVGFVGTTMKGASAIPAAGQHNAAAFGKRQIEIMDRIDRGEVIPELDDAYGYQHMSPVQRETIRAEAQRASDAFDPTPLAERGLYKAGETVSAYAKTILPATEGYETAVGRQLGEGIGSLVAGLPAGFLGRVPSAVFFAAGGAGEAAERAIHYSKVEQAAGRPGLSEEQIAQAALMGVAPGATDMLPLEFLLGRMKFPAALTGKLASIVGRIGGQAFVEGVQEGGQQFLQNMIAQEYNPEQALTEGVLPSAGIGSGVGGIAQAAKETAQLALRGFAGRRGGGMPTPEQAQEAVQGVVEQVAADPAAAVQQAVEAAPEAIPAILEGIQEEVAAPAAEEAQPQEADERLRAAGWDINQVPEEEQADLYRTLSPEAKALSYMRSRLDAAADEEANWRAALAQRPEATDESGSIYQIGVETKTKSEVEQRLSELGTEIQELREGVASEAPSKEALGLFNAAADEGAAAPDVKGMAIPAEGAQPEDTSRLEELAEAFRINTPAAAVEQIREIVEEQAPDLVPALDELASPQPEAPKAYAYERLSDESNFEGRTFYHGTKAPLAKLSDADVFGFGDAESLYGIGLYLTDNPAVAKSYATTKGKGGPGKVFAGNLANVRLIDLDKPLPSDAQAVFRQAMDEVMLPRQIESALSGNGREAFDDYREAMDSEGLTKAEALENLQNLAVDLGKLGYDGLVHEGGQRVNRNNLGPHNVVILFENAGYKDGQRVGKGIKENLTDVDYTPEEDAVSPEVKPMEAPTTDAPSVQETAAEAPPPVGGEMRAMQATAGKVADSLARAPTAGLAEPSQSLADLVSSFNRALGITVRQGRLNAGLKASAGKAGNKLRGQASTVTGVIRLAVVNEIDTLAHEGGHALENRFKGALEAVKQQRAAELTPLASPGPDALSEGFAEWFRRYITNPAAATRTAPGFERAFQEFMQAADPTAMQQLEAIRTGYQEWVKAPSAGVVASSVVSRAELTGIRGVMREVKEQGLNNTIKLYTDRFYTAVFDDLHPIRVAVDGLMEIASANVGQNLQKGQKLALKAANNPYKLLRLARDAYSAGHMDIMHGVRPYHGLNPSGPSLRDAMVTAFGGTDRDAWNEEVAKRFGAYLTSRRFVQEWDRYFAGDLTNTPDKFSQADHQMAIAEFEAAYPQFRRAAQQLYAFQNNMLAKKRDAGLITSEMYDTLTQRSDYVPVMRDMSDRGPSADGTPARADRMGIMKRFRGSQRDVINPLESIAKDAYETAMIIARNDAVKALDALARAAGPIGGAFAERIPASEMAATQVNVQEAIRSAAKDAGIDPLDLQVMIQAVDDQLGDNAITTIWRGGEISEKGEAIVYLWEEGNRIPIRLADKEFGRDMLQAMTGLSQEYTNWFINALSLPATIVRTGITASLDFIFANYLRDQVSAWVLTEDSVPFVSGARGVYDDLAKKDISRIYSSVGGIMGGANTATLHNARVKREILDLRKRRGIAFRDAPLTNILRLTEFTETGSRLGIFRNAFDRSRADGLTEFESALEAAYAARDYIDFGRHGSKMLIVRRIIPFFNASLQGLDRTRRGLTGKVNNDRILRDAISPYIKARTGQPLSVAEQKKLPLAAKTWAKMVSLAGIGLALSLLYKDDEEYEEISDYIRATHWLFKVDGEWYRVPKPFELGVFSNLAERTFEYTYRNDPTAVDRFVSGLGQIVMPPLDVPGIKLPVELAANYNFFTGRPIVSEHLKRLPPELQFNAYASQFGKELGAEIGVSPALIDHVVTGFGASYGRAMLQATDSFENYIDPATLGTDVFDAFIGRRFSKEIERGADSTRKFWEMVGYTGGTYTQAANGYKHFVKARDALAAKEFLERLPDEEKAYAILEASQTERNAKLRKIHPLNRANEIVTIVNSIRKDINLEKLRDKDGEDIAVSVIQRREAQTILGNLQMRETRNALVALGIEGWAQKKVMPIEGVMKELETIAPQVHEELVKRLNKEKLPSYEDSRKEWPEARKRLLAEGDEAILNDLYMPEFN